MLIAEILSVMSEDGNGMLAGQLSQDAQAADSSPAVGGNHAPAFTHSTLMTAGQNATLSA
jgi:hypothetical protein